MSSNPIEPLFTCAKYYPHSLVLVGYRKDFEHDLNKSLSQSSLNILV